MKKIILRLEGGLGNQLFQYAFARYIQERTDSLIILDLHTYRKDKQRSLSLNNFVLNNNVVYDVNVIFKLLIIYFRLTSKIFKELSGFLFRNNIEKQIKFLSTFGFYLQLETTYSDYFKESFSNYFYISGNWMSFKFFSNVSNFIKEEFKPKSLDLGLDSNLVSYINSSNSVCVHIRRGDYVSSNWSKKLLICDFNYYSNCINRIKELVSNPVFFIFSNSSQDIEWIKNNYAFSGSIYYVDCNNPDYKELYLMSFCKHFILSNSSFSWWASFLAQKEDKIILAPSKWNSGVWNMSDIYMDSWELITVD